MFLQAMADSGRGSDAHDAIVRRLDGAGVHYELLSHDPVYTMADVQRCVQVAKPEKVKTLVLRARGAGAEQILLCGIGEDARLDIRAVASHLGVARSRLSMLSPEQAADALGMPVGAMGLVAPSPGPLVLLSKRFRGCEYLCFGAGRHDRTLRVRASDLPRLGEVRIVAAEV